MTTPIEQFAAANKANLEALVALSQKAFGTVEKLAELNMQAARSAMDDSAEHAKALLAAKNPQDLVAVQNALLQPAADKATAYGRQVQEIVAETQAEVTKMVEAQIADAQKTLQELIEAAAKNAPAGSENAVAMFKSAISSANTAFETAQKAAKQAASTAQANMTALTEQATKAAKAATKAK